jgi:hypothetical protein
MRHRWLVVMAKQPRAGAVKSRLAAQIGAAQAVRFYRVNLARTLRTLGRDPRWTTILAVSPDTATSEPVWPNDVPVIGQGGGDLGVRMQAIMDRFPPGPVVIVGSDIPGIEPAHVSRAFDLLGGHDVAFGPAEDGGYWLVGLKRFPRVPRIFANVRWSGAHALSDTLKNCRRLRVAHAATLADVDSREDWLMWNRRG